MTSRLNFHFSLMSTGKIWISLLHPTNLCLNNRTNCFFFSLYKTTNLEIIFQIDFVSHTVGDHGSENIHTRTKILSVKMRKVYISSDIYLLAFVFGWNHVFNFKVILLISFLVQRIQVVIFCWSISSSLLNIDIFFEFSENSILLSQKKRIGWIIVVTWK